MYLERRTINYPIYLKEAVVSPLHLLTYSRLSNKQTCAFILFSEKILQSKIISYWYLKPKDTETVESFILYSTLPAYPVICTCFAIRYHLPILFLPVIFEKPSSLCAYLIVKITLVLTSIFITANLTKSH